jgi:hypothetical protein
MTNSLQVMIFWNLYIVPFLFQTQHFGDWILSPSSGKRLLRWELFKCQDLFQN